MTRTVVRLLAGSLLALFTLSAPARAQIGSPVEYGADAALAFMLDPSVVVLSVPVNDVRIGFADNVRNPTTGTPITSCISGSTLDFKADFHVELTAQARYDIGLYFATDGDAAHDGARAGQCSVSKITATNNTGNFINLDNPDEGTEGVDLVPLKARQREVKAVLNNSFGFGGTNASLVMKAI